MGEQLISFLGLTLSQSDLNWLDWVFQQEALLFAIFLTGALVHTTLGFGFPLITTPLISLFFDLRSAILITLIPTLLNNSLNIIYGGPFFNLLKRFWLLALMGIIGSLLGSILILYFPPEPFNIFLAITILTYLIFTHYTGSAQFSTSFLKESIPTSILVGLIGGIVGGVVNVSLVIFLIYFINLRLEKNEIIKSLNFCFILGKLTQIATFVFKGYFDFSVLLIIFEASLGLVPGIFVGIWLRKKIDLKLFKKIIQVTLITFCILLTYRSIQYFYGYWMKSG